MILWFPPHTEQDILDHDIESQAGAAVITGDKVVIEKHYQHQLQPNFDRRFLILKKMVNPRPQT